MKKIVTLLLALSMIIAVSFSLSSCDMVNQNSPDTKEDVITVEDGYLVVNGVKTEYKVLIDDENHDNTDDEGNTENGDNNTEVRTTVTEEEWNANMEQTNFTVSMARTVGTETLKAIYCFTDTNKSYEMSEPIELKQKFYFTIQDGVEYQVVENEDGSWSGSQCNLVTESLGKLSGFNTTYSSWVYDAEKKAYSFEDDDGNIHWCYFEDGIIAKYETEEAEVSLVLIFSNIGTTVVEVPEFSIVDSDYNGGNNIQGGDGGESGPAPDENPEGNSQAN